MWLRWSTHSLNAFHVYQGPSKFCKTTIWFVSKRLWSRRGRGRGVEAAGLQVTSKRYNNSFRFRTVSPSWSSTSILMKESKRETISYWCVTYDLFDVWSWFIYAVGEEGVCSGGYLDGGLLGASLERRPVGAPTQGSCVGRWRRTDCRGACDAWPVFWFQSSFRADFRAVSEQFQSSFGAVSEQFQSSFRAVSKQFQKELRE